MPPIRASLASNNLVNLKYRAIFWFLAILSLTNLIPLVLFFPETLRAIVGNGSIPARGLNRSAWSIIKGRKKGAQELAEVEASVKKEINPVSLQSFMNASERSNLTSGFVMCSSSPFDIYLRKTLPSFFFTTPSITMRSMQW